MDTRIKYPRTSHLPYSLSMTDDDKTLESDEQFAAMDKVVVTIKMDGENTTVYPDGYLHARSLDSKSKPWQEKVTALSRNWFWKIPDGWRVCGENLQAKHSIGYTFGSMEDLFQCFGIYDEENICLSWEDTVAVCRDFGIRTVPEIYSGKYDKDAILAAFDAYCRNVAPQEVEGFVVRNADAFPYDAFRENTGKYVRANHVQTDGNWSREWTNNIIENQENNH